MSIYGFHGAIVLLPGGKIIARKPAFFADCTVEKTMEDKIESKLVIRTPLHLKNPNIVRNLLRKRDLRTPSA